MLESIEMLRKDADICTQMAGAENEFETVWITKSALLKDIDAIEREVNERHVELPKDKYGESIHVGDMMQGAKVCGGWCEPFEVVAMTFYSKGVCTVLDPDGVEHVCAETRHKPHTVEDVLREIVHKCQPTYSKDGSYTTGLTEEEFAEYVAKLQLKEVE